VVLAIGSPPRPRVRAQIWMGFGLVAILLVAAMVDPFLTVAFAATVVLVVAALRSPDLAAALLLFAGFTNASDILERDHGFPALGAPLLLLLVAAIAIRTERERAHRTTRAAPTSPAASLLPIIVALALVQLVSSFWAAHSAHAVQLALDTVREGALALAVATAIRDVRGLRRAVWAVIAAGGLIATIAVYQYATSAFTSNFGGFARATIESIVGESNNYRLSGPFDDPNFFAMVLVLVVPLALDRALHERRIAPRLLGVMASLMCVLAVVVTFSRGGFIALAVVTFLVILRERPGPKVLLAGAALGVIVLALAPPQYTERLSTIPQAIPGSPIEQPGADVSIRGRTSEVTVGLQMFEDHPVFGVGAGSYGAHYEEYSRRLGLDPRREERDAHDLYAEIGAELGVVGLLVFGLLAVATGRRLRTARRMLAESPGRDGWNLVGALGASLVAYLVTSIFLHASYTRSVWLLVGLAFATPSIAARQREDDERGASVTAR
jgi:putative inorganic carbon (HCO3(-)) transporter